ncbi:MAG: hypothetical protein IT379_30710 [Deltaproteobacteria bacterium]|nr:hypothetical protein [Deltaproteobacteria bacterium]
MFDELVVDDWLHVEWLDERVWWMRLGDARIQVEICDDGIAKVDIVRGFYEPVRGESSTTQEPAAT